MLVTNLPEHGGDLSRIFFDEFRNPKTNRLRMVSGYVGRETLAQLQKEILKREDVAVELVVGMAAKEGLTQSTYDLLLNLNKELSDRNHPRFKQQGVYAFFASKEGDRSRGMHAKAYLFDKASEHCLIVGSSNFSFSGLSASGNVEMNVVDSSSELATSYSRFFEDLHEKQLIVPIDKIVDFPIRGKSQLKRSSSPSSLLKVRKPEDFKKHKFVDIDLAPQRIDLRRLGLQRLALLLDRLVDGLDLGKILIQGESFLGASFKFAKRHRLHNRLDWLRTCRLLHQRPKNHGYC
ncbi:MAG: NgoFVII family restriction endonuclease [Planctomycetes bacterium]|nr:NgoFVII family restriction endonuclease [Planctomycetota bacterium]